MASTAPTRGNVYGAVSVFQGLRGNNEIKFVRSTDHGVTFSHPTRISEGSLGNQSADIAVASNGDVYVTWNGTVGSRARGRDAMLFVKSTDGGRSFTKPRVAAEFDGFDAADTVGDPEAAARPTRRPSSRPTVRSPRWRRSPRATRATAAPAPSPCLSGFVFFRHHSQPHITADPKGNPNRLWLVYDASVPSTEVPSTSTYNTAPVAADGTQRVAQGAIYLTSTTNGGATWSTPTRLAPQPVGHQFFPDVNADGGRLFAIWHDSRNDPGYSVQNPPGNATAKDAAGFHLATRGLDTYGASSTDGGATWSQVRLSTRHAAAQLRDVR